MPISVFISYRRDGGEGFAHMFNMMLEQKGYHVFYDIESIGVGLFNQKILEEIEAADVFLLILTKGALDRCVHEGDWVRREIAHALSLDKPVIPMIFRDFAFPEELPQEIARVALYNGVDISNMAYFDARLEHLTHMIDAAASTCATPKRTPEALTDEGNRLYESEQYAEAAACYREAAEAGYVRAQYDLALCYQKGHGVAKDLTQAVGWYRRAAEQGDAAAQCNLGFCYSQALGVERDRAQAAYWYRRAAEQDHAAAQSNLGYCYLNGNGVKKNKTEATYWLRKAAEQGHATGQTNLGYCLEYGIGVGRDTAQAVEWYRRAAEQGYDLAQYNLGMCYELGTGIEKDIAQAKEWYSRAAAQGHAKAAKRLANLH